MKIKKYQAPTMREALERVKEDLGENALVLETKRVRSRGLFGRGGRELIEVRVSADANTNGSGAAAKKSAKSEKSSPSPDPSPFTSLNLTDDTPAAPSVSAQTPHPRTERVSAQAFAALAARAATSFSAETNSADAYSLAQPAQTPSPQNNVVGVELADTPPRSLAAANRPARGRLAANAASAGTAAAATEPTSSALAVSPPAGPTRGAVTVELERLRAELREVKFSINSLHVRSASAAQIEDAEKPAGAAARDLENDPGLYQSPFYEAYCELLDSGLPAELAHRAVRAAILGGADLAPRDSIQAARFGLRRALPTLIKFAHDPLALTPVTSGEGNGVAPARRAVVFVGPTGVGKTTTIAKLAARLALRERRRVELITLDTYRIAAVEQLKTYAEIIGTRCHVARSVVEVDALTRRFAGEATILIDTVGRNPHDLADQMELADYLRAGDDLAKCLVLQATTHPADALAAARKFALYGADHLVLTKLDETARPAASVGVAAESDLPLAYLCHGQRVPEDIELATADAYANRTVRPGLDHQGA